MEAVSPYQANPQGYSLSVTHLPKHDLQSHAHLFQNQNSLRVTSGQIKMRPISTAEIHCSEKPLWTDRGRGPVSRGHEEDPLPLADRAHGLLRRAGRGAEEEPCGEGAGTRYRVCILWAVTLMSTRSERRCLRGCVSSFSLLLLLLFFKRMVCSGSLSPYCWRMIKRRFLE